MGFSGDVRVMDSRKIQSTNLDKALGDTNSSLHQSVHAHSLDTVRRSYLLEPTRQFDTGTALLYLNKPVQFDAMDLDLDREARELERMQTENQKIKHALHEAIQTK